MTTMMKAAAMERDRALLTPNVALFTHDGRQYVVAGRAQVEYVCEAATGRPATVFTPGFYEAATAALG